MHTNPTLESFLGSTIWSDLRNHCVCEGREEDNGACRDPACARVLAEQLSRLSGGVDAAAGHLGVSKRTMSRRLKMAGLPTAETWMAFGRCLRTVAVVKAGTAVWRSALLTGWPDPSNFYKRCRALFGRTPKRLSKMSEAQAIDLLLTRQRGEPLPTCRSPRRCCGHGGLGRPGPAPSSSGS
jgi:AraC-like DNA-binding protein